MRQLPDDTHVRALTPCSFDLVTRMRDYFQLDTPLIPLYAEWERGHERMKVRGHSLDML